jgi:putative PIN family toxin of toxin-antitoxin system
VLRVVVDPGVLVSALISKTGKPAQLMLRWTEGAFDLVVSPALLHELSEVLVRSKFERYVKHDDARDYLERLSREAVWIDDPIEVESGLTPDPGDDYLVALARSAGAHVLVSGDPHLTEIEDARPPVMTPRAFLEGLDP